MYLDNKLPQMRRRFILVIEPDKQWQTHVIVLFFIPPPASQDAAVQQMLPHALW